VSEEQTILRQAQPGPANVVELLGDLHPLLAQLGSAEGLVRLNTAAEILGRDAVDSCHTLTLFLEAYRSEILLPLELPVIARAYHHVQRNEARELVALDREVAAHQLFRDFASASRRVGQSQLRRLRPLRDARIVRRYLLAVEGGTAEGWHTIVYGLTLALYSLPVCQGLLNYARRSLSGFIHAAARPLKFSEADCRELVEGLCVDLPRSMETFLATERISIPAD
jgi:urease accessory protein UreF